MNSVLSNWSDLLELLPADLEASAKEHKAFLRARGVPSASALLQLFLVYSTTSLSFRQTVAWAEASQTARLTDVSLIERMERSESWLLHLVGQMLEQARPVVSSACRPVHLVDATTVRTPKGGLWRVHIVYNAQTGCFEQIRIEDEHIAETFSNFDAEPGVLYVGDRGYNKQGGIEAMLKEHAQILCRVRGSKYLQHANPNAIVEHSVPTGRIIIAPIPQEKQLKVEKKLKRRAVKRQTKLQAKTLEINRYVFLFCSDPTLTSEEILALYRWRWQVELLFKRLKSLQGLDEITVNSPPLCRAVLLCHTLVYLIAQKLSQKMTALFPPESLEAAVSLAALAIPLSTNPTGFTLPAIPVLSEERL